MGNCSDPLFTVQFPHTGTAVTSHGVRFPIPVQYFDAALYGAVGTADLAAEQSATVGTPYVPVVTSAGRGIGTLLMADYADDDLGPYRESMIAFPVHLGDQVTVADDPGPMVAALFDPTNEVWAVRLLLDQQLPIDAGRELFGIPKVPTPESMAIDITTTHVAFDFREPDGTPIMSGDVTLDPAAAPASAADLASQPGTANVLSSFATRSYLHLSFVYPDIRYPGALNSIEVAGRVGAGARAALAPYGDDSHIAINDEAPYANDLAALAFTPEVSLVIENLHTVLGQNI